MVTVDCGLWSAEPYFVILYRVLLTRSIFKFKKKKIVKSCVDMRNEITLIFTLLDCKTIGFVLRSCGAGNNRR